MVKTFFCIFFFPFLKHFIYGNWPIFVVENFDISFFFSKLLCFYVLKSKIQILNHFIYGNWPIFVVENFDIFSFQNYCVFMFWNLKFKFGKTIVFFSTRDVHFKSLMGKKRGEVHNDRNKSVGERVALFLWVFFFLFFLSMFSWNMNCVSIEM